MLWLNVQIKGWVTRIVLPRGDFHPWFEFTPVSDQTNLSVYILNRDEISPLLLFRPCLQELTPGVIRHDFNV